MGPSLGSGGRGRGQAVTLRGLWREGGGGRARRVGGLAAERACHPGARCRRLLRLGGGLGLRALARTLASEPQKRSARRGPDPVGTAWAHRPAPETQVPTHQDQMSSLGCAIAGGSGWDGGWWLAAGMPGVS